jgi:hypothetical protein
MAVTDSGHDRDVEFPCGLTGSVPTEPGPPGPQGERGQRGEKGLSPAVRRAIGALFLVMFALIGAAYAGLWYQQQQYNQQRCESIAEIAAIPVPVPTAGNPSRAWVARYSQIDRARGVQLGCRLPAPRYARESP